MVGKNRINLGGGKAKKYLWSGRKGKIIVVLLVIVAVLAALQVFAKVPVSTVVQEPVYYIFGFTQDLYAAGDDNPYQSRFDQRTNMMVFPYSILACQPDTSCETIFDSVIDDIIVVYRLIPNDVGGYITKSWRPDVGYNTFSNIDPYTTYLAVVDSDCTFELKCPD